MVPNVFSPYCCSGGKWVVVHKRNRSTKTPDLLVGMEVSPKGESVGGPDGGLWSQSTMWQRRGESLAALFTLAPSS